MDPAVSRYLTWERYTDESEVKKYFESAIQKQSFPDEVLAILVGDSFIGTIHIILRQNAYAQLGFNTFTQYQQYNDIGNLIMHKIIEHMKQSQWWAHIKEIWIDCHKKNIFMTQVAMSYGFIYDNKDVGLNRVHYYSNTKNL